jgi:hypothetical protein
MVLSGLVAGGVAAWLLLAGLPLGPGARDPPSDPPLSSPSSSGPVPIPAVRFKDITKAAGIHFVHTNGAFGMKLLPETMGSGVAFLDYDNDGRQDILFINSCYWPGHEDELKPKPTLALYRNKGDGTFEAVTKAVGHGGQSRARAFIAVRWATL